MTARHEGIQGSRERGATERIDGLLSAPCEWDVVTIARLCRCSYWTASRHLAAEFLAKRAVRTKSGSGGRVGRRGFLYRGLRK